MVVLGGGGGSYERGTPAGCRDEGYPSGAEHVREGRLVATDLREDALDHLFQLAHLFSGVRL